jgi:ATP-dependent DNA helicase RecG
LIALAHRSYMGSMIQMRVYDSKINLWNPGLLPEELESEKLKTHHVSYPRNPIIADICFKAGYIDSWGRGTIKIFDTCKEAGLPEPEIINMQGGVLATIYKKENELTIEQANDQAGGAIQDLTERQKEVLTIIVTDNKISYRAIAEQLKINESAVLKHLELLKEKGFIERQGGTRGYWKILK